MAMIIIQYNREDDHETVKMNYQVAQGLRPEFQGLSQGIKTYLRQNINHHQWHFEHNQDIKERFDALVQRYKFHWHAMNSSKSSLSFSNHYTQLQKVILELESLLKELGDYINDFKELWLMREYDKPLLAENGDLDLGSIALFYDMPRHLKYKIRSGGRVLSETKSFSISQLTSMDSRIECEVADTNIITGERQIFKKIFDMQ